MMNNSVIESDEYFLSDSYMEDFHAQESSDSEDYLKYASFSTNFHRIFSNLNFNKMFLAIVMKFFHIMRTHAFYSVIYNT